MANRIIITQGRFKNRKGTYIRTGHFYEDESVIRLDGQKFVFSFKNNQFKFI